MEKAKSCVTFCRPRRLAAILAGALLLGSADTLAEERRNFLGETITVEPGRFFVTADVNVRAKPTANSEKVGRFGKGEKIQVVGRLDKQWYALEKDGQDLGFVYAPVLIPLIDGGLDKPLRGMTVGPNQSPCEYIVRFEGREQIKAKVPIPVANYEVGWRCRVNKRRDRVVIAGYMFITETPYDGTRRPRYQLSVDLPGIADEPEFVFSTTMILDVEKKQLRYEGVTLPKLGKKPNADVKPAPNVARALSQAMELAPETWGAELWKILLKAKRG